MTDTKIIQYPTGDNNNHTDDDERTGTYHKNTGMKPPPPQPGMLNPEIAEAAAKVFNKKEKKIQAACAKVDAKLQGKDDQTTTKQRCACIIM
jgi:hypothetical protein